MTEGGGFESLFVMARFTFVAIAPLVPMLLVILRMAAMTGARQFYCEPAGFMTGFTPG